MTVSGGFTQTIDWLAFTLPKAEVADVIAMIRGLDDFELLRAADHLSGLHGQADGLHCDRRLPVVQRHIDPCHMALLGKDPGQHRLQLRLVPLGDNSG